MLPTHTQLLGRWAELEGDRCRACTGGYQVWLRGHWFALETMPVALLLALYEAAEGHGFVYSQKYLGTHCCTVQAQLEGGGGLGHTVTDADAAVAFGIAYLQTLEAIKSRS